MITSSQLHLAETKGTIPLIWTQFLMNVLREKVSKTGLGEFPQYPLYLEVKNFRVSGQNAQHFHN